MLFKQNNTVFYNSINKIFDNFKQNKKNIINEVLILTTINNIFKTCNLEISDSKEKELNKIYRILSNRITTHCPECISSKYKPKNKFFTSSTKFDKPITLSTLAFSNGDITNKYLPLKGGVISDRVTYTNLTTNSNYVLVTKVFNKTLGQFTNLAKSTIFTPISRNGFIDISFNIEVSESYNFYLDNPGTHFVFYQYLYNAHSNVSDRQQLLATHENPNDLNQTLIYNIVPEITSTHVINNFYSNNDYIVSDRLVFNNLFPYTDYKLKTVFIHKKTEQPYQMLPEKFTDFNTGLETSFTKDFEFIFDKETLRSHQLTDIVVYEYLYLNNELVASHTDMYDENQYLTIPLF